MADKQVTIEIAGDSSRAKATIEDLKTFTNKNLGEISKQGKSSTKEVSAAFRQMGIRTKADIQASSESARQAYLTIKNSGTASANDIKRAHNAMTAKIKANNRELAGSTSKLSGIISSLKAPFLGFLAVGTGVKLFKDMTAAALGNEIQVRKLKTQVDLLGISYNEHEKSIQKAINATAKYALVQSGDVSEVLQHLLFVTGDLTKSQEALNLVYDLAHLKSIDVKTAAELVGKALSGNVESLSRYFVEFKGLNKTLGENATLQDKAAFAMAFLNEKVAGSLDNMTDNERAVRFVKNEWASFVQLAGEKIFIVLNKMIIFLKQARIGLLQTANGVLYLSRGFTWLTDRLGITERATETVNFAMEDITNQINDARKNLDKAIGATEKLTDSQGELAGSSAALAEQIKLKNEALKKGEGRYQRETEAVKELTRAEQLELEQLKKRVAFEQSQQQARVDFLRSMGREAEARAVEFTPSPIALAEGGKIPGYGGGDKVPAMLEAGEFVLRKEAVKKLGLNMINAINRMDMRALTKKMYNQKVQKFVEGGLVKSSSDSVNVNLLMNDKSYSMQSTRETADSLVGNIKRMNIIHGRRKMPY